MNTSELNTAQAIEPLYHVLETEKGGVQINTTALRALLTQLLHSLG